MNNHFILNSPTNYYKVRSGWLNKVPAGSLCCLYCPTDLCLKPASVHSCISGLGKNLTLAFSWEAFYVKYFTRCMMIISIELLHFHTRRTVLCKLAPMNIVFYVFLLQTIPYVRSSHGNKLLGKSDKSWERESLSAGWFETSLGDGQMCCFTCSIDGGHSREVLWLGFFSSVFHFFGFQRWILLSYYRTFGTIRRLFLSV